MTFVWAAYTLSLTWHLTSATLLEFFLLEFPPGVLHSLFTRSKGLWSKWNSKQNLPSFVLLFVCFDHNPSLGVLSRASHPSLTLLDLSPIFTAYSSSFSEIVTCSLSCMQEPHLIDSKEVTVQYSEILQDGC